MRFCSKIILHQLKLYLFYSTRIVKSQAALFCWRHWGSIETIFLWFVHRSSSIFHNAPRSSSSFLKPGKSISFCSWPITILIVIYGLFTCANTAYLVQQGQDQNQKLNYNSRPISCLQTWFVYISPSADRAEIHPIREAKNSNSWRTREPVTR